MLPVAGPCSRSQRPDSRNPILPIRSTAHLRTDVSSAICIASLCNAFSDPATASGRLPRHVELLTDARQSALSVDDRGLSMQP